MYVCLFQMRDTVETEATDVFDAAICDFLLFII